LNQARVPADAVGWRIGAPADLHPGRRRFEPAQPGDLRVVARRGRKPNPALGRCRPLARADEGNRALTRY
jgi:hypothetical protein